jgi:hypothetical protein
VRVVNDFASEEHRAIGKPLPRLVGIVNGAVDAVAEAELAGEVHREPAGREAIVALLDRRHERAVVALGERPGDFVLEIEPFSEDERGWG